MHYLIKDLNQYEKPREKLLKYGANNLTDIELLALLLRSGGKEKSALDLARQLKEKYNKLSDLVNVDVQQLSQFKFIDIAKASAIVAAVEFAVRISSEKNLEKCEAVKSPQDLFTIMRKDLFGKSKEHLFLVSLNSRNKIIAKDLISVGTVNETMMSPREILRQALLRNAVGIVLVHNHPSNDPAPSDDDILSTRKLAQITASAGLLFLDHLIVSDTTFISMKNLGLLEQFKGGD
jgi:DNA repair protein RadC